MLLPQTKSKYTEAVFGIVDHNEDGTLDFNEFVSAVTTICMFTPEQVLKFCFYLYDKDRSGFIEQEEYDDMLANLHEGEPPGALAVAMEKMDENNDGRLDFEEFTHMNDRFPFLLSPAFNFQFSIQRITLGEDWWLKQSEKIMQFASRRAESQKWRRVAADQDLQDERKKGIFKIVGKVMGTLIWKSLVYMEKHATYECNDKFELVRGTSYVVNDIDTMLVVNPSQLKLEDNEEMSWAQQDLARRDALQALKSVRQERTFKRKQLRKGSSDVVPISIGNTDAMDATAV